MSRGFGALVAGWPACWRAGRVGSSVVAGQRFARAGVVALDAAGRVWQWSGCAGGLGVASNADLSIASSGGDQVSWEWPLRWRIS